MIWIWNTLLLMIFKSVSSDLTCFLDLSPDPLHSCELRWGLLINKNERCGCTKILAKTKFPTSPCFTPKICDDFTEIWFTDAPGRLTDRRVWNTEKLKFLLNCSHIEVNDCEPNQCKNGATCFDEIFSYRCQCADGYEGDNCQIVCTGSLYIENCPTDFFHQEPAFCGTVPVNWNEPSATHDCGYVIEVEKTHEPGADFSAGTTTVTYTFTDSHNQETCQFDVHVSTLRIEDDVLPPIIADCPEHINKVLEPGQTTNNIWWTSPTARDGSGLSVTLIHQTRSPGDTFTVGGYELVKYTFADVAGNEAICEFAITLYSNGVTIDTSPPVVPEECNPHPEWPDKVFMPTGDTSVEYEVLPLSPATDNDGQTPRVTYVTYPPGVYTLSLGRYEVDAYYYDSSGNRATCYRLVHIRYEDAPVRTSFKNCPSNVHLEIPAGTTTRFCWEVPELVDEAGNPVATTSMPYDGKYWYTSEGTYLQTHQSGEQFAIDGCREQLVQYIFWDHYNNWFECDFIVSVRAIGQDDLPGEWSQWYDKSTPTKWYLCDCETNHDIAAACPSGLPVDAQCETLTGQDWRSVGQVAYCCTIGGFKCQACWNNGEDCYDYRVRYKCPLP